LAKGQRGGPAPRGPSIGFFAPSGFLPDAAVMDRAAAFFAARGWRVSAGESVFAREQRFAGPDTLRAQELQRFATDSGLDVAVSARGGYGLTRLLGDIDFDAIAAARLPLVGYSDFTVVNLALLARAGGISFQGPSAADFFPENTTGDAATAAGARANRDEFFAALSSAEHVVEFAGDEQAARHVGLAVRGRLWGGNLSMLCSLLGTPYFPRVAGGILFLEDVNEAAYRIERLLLQLLHAGVLGRQRAIVLGEFTAVPVMPSDNGYDLSSAWAALRARCDVPLIGGLPLGHARRRTTLAVGARARLAVGAGGQVTLAYSGHPLLRSAVRDAGGQGAAARRIRA
jgi:muramoyltetrapeptide carboxypeptidase